MTLRKKFVLLMVIGVAAAASISSTASAGTMKGALSQTGAFPQPSCDYEMTYTGGPPPANVTVDADSFVGVSGGSLPPCDPDLYDINNDLNVSFSGSGSNWTATLSSISFTDNVFTGCTFTRTAATNTTSTTGLTGLFVGGGSASGSGGFLCLFGTTLAITARF